MADPRKISRLRRGLARGAVWLAIVTSICYVTLFEPNYRAHTVCDGATWTRVVVDPLLSGVKKPILIGSNAGYLFVISSGECETRRKRRRGAEDHDWMSFASDWFDRTWGYVSGYWNSLWPNGEPESPPGSNGEPESPPGSNGEPEPPPGSNDEPEPPPGSNDEPEPPTGWFDSAWGYVSDRWNYLLNGGAKPPPAVVVPLSRVLCMYEYKVDAGDNGPSVSCKASANELDLSTLETRLTEIRDLLRSLRPPAPGQATLLPVHLLLHFRNAQLSDPNGGLSGSGVVLEPLHERMLAATVDTLRKCATPDSPVTIRPYGFASSTPFEGRDDTDDLNVKAANRRASAVYKALGGRLPDGSHVSVEEPLKWETFAAMVKERDECIESPSEEGDRDPFLDRVVVLDLQTSGRCAPADWAARLIRCSGSEGADP